MIETILTDSSRNTTVKFLWRSIKDHHATIDNHSASTNRFHFFQDMGRKNDRTIFAEVAHKLAHFEFLIGIETIGRFVQDQDGRIMQESLRDSRTSLVTLGKSFDALTTTRLEMHALYGTIHTRRNFLASISPSTRGECKEIFDAHFGVCRRSFWQISKVALCAKRVESQIDSSDLDCSCISLEKTRQHAHCG